MRAEVTEGKGRQSQKSRTVAGWEGVSVLDTVAPGQEYHLPLIQTIQYYIATYNSGRTPTGNELHLQNNAIKMSPFAFKFTVSVDLLLLITQFRI